MRGAHRDHARRRVRDVAPRSPREVGPFAALRGEPRARCCASSATTAGPRTTPPPAEYEGLTVTPVGIDAAVLPAGPARRRPAARADRMLELGEKHGYRNAQVTVIAPTGTIGLVMDCDTTGIEPDFALVKFKKLAGGGYFKIINQSVPPALAKLGYAPRQIDDIVRYCRGAGDARTAARTSTPAALKAKGFTDEVLDEGRGAAARRVRAAVRLQPLDARRRLPQATRSKIPAETLDDPAFDLLAHLGFTQAAGRRGEHATSAAR